MRGLIDTLAYVWFRERGKPVVRRLEAIWACLRIRWRIGLVLHPWRRYALACGCLVLVLLTCGCAVRKHVPQTKVVERCWADSEQTDCAQKLTWIVPQ